MADLSVTPDELRGWAKDCGDISGKIEEQLDPAAAACEDLRKATDGWAFADALTDLQDRWEDLNELLREELDDTAESFEESADQYDDDESRIVEIFRHLF